MRTRLIAAIFWLGSLSSAPAHAGCGSAFCTVNADWGTQGLWTEPGGRIDLRFEFIDLDQPKQGATRVDLGQIPEETEEIQTINRNWVATFDYNFDGHWGVNVIAPLVDPDTNKTLAFEATYLGIARVARAGDPALVELTTVTQEVGKGDKLLPAGKAEGVVYAPHAPLMPVDGRVMSIYGSVGRVGEAGPQSIITINRGKANGLEVGHVVALFRPGASVSYVTGQGSTRAEQAKFAEERYGLAFVFRVFDRLSYALVMRVERPVSPLDVVRAP